MTTLRARQLVRVGKVRTNVARASCEWFTGGTPVPQLLPLLTRLTVGILKSSRPACDRQSPIFDRCSRQRQMAG